MRYNTLAILCLCIYQTASSMIGDAAARADAPPALSQAIQELARRKQQSSACDHPAVFAKGMLASGVLMTSLKELMWNMPNYISAGNTQAPYDTFIPVSITLLSAYILHNSWQHMFCQPDDPHINEELAQLTQEKITANPMCCICHDDELPSTRCTLFTCCTQTICKQCDQDVKTHGITTCPHCRQERYKTIDDILR